MDLLTVTAHILQLDKSRQPDGLVEKLAWYLRRIRAHCMVVVSVRVFLQMTGSRCLPRRRRTEGGEEEKRQLISEGKGRRNKLCGKEKKKKVEGGRGGK